MSLNRLQPRTAAGKLSNRRSPHALLRSLILACLVSLVPLGIAATPAQAEITQLGEFAGPGSGLGELERETGVAVDQATNDVYVGDTTANRVNEYKPGGQLVLMFGEHVNKTATEKH